MRARLLTLSIEPLMAPFWVEFAIDGRVLAFLTLTCLSAALIFGLAPALHTSRANVRELATAAGPAGAAGRPARRWMGWLVTAELALTLVLLAGAGLMARSLLTLARADRVIDTAGVATLQVGLPDARYPTAAERIAFFRTLHEQVAASPAIASVTGASAIPFAPGGAARRTVAIDGRPLPDGDSAPTARVVAIANDYFGALGLRLQRGRSFTDRDGTAGNDSVIVNRRFADLLLTDGAPPARQTSQQELRAREAPTPPPGRAAASASRPTDPAGVRAVPPRRILGRRIRLTPAGEAGEPGPWLTIVGVSPTVRQSMAEAPGPVAYLPYRAEPLPFLELLVRGEQGADAAARAVGQIVRGLDPEVPIGRVWTLDGVLGQTLFIPRLIGSLLGAFAWVALVLSAVGLYGVTAYAVTQRTQEIGVRMALGAQAGQVRWMVLRRGLAQLGAGFALGLWGALTVGRLFEAWLVDTPPTDPVTQAVVAALLGGVSVAACVWPARRAARLDPVAALRHE
jgi:putative ABC transport system permease protein